MASYLHLEHHTPEFVQEEPRHNRGYLQYYHIGSGNSLHTYPEPVWTVSKRADYEEIDCNLQKGSYHSLY